MKVKLRLSVFRKKVNSKMWFPHRHACVDGLHGFRGTAERVPTGSQKTGRCASVKQHCGNGKRRRRASNLPANKFQNQYNSKCSWMQAADLMPLSVWTVAIFCHRKNFQNRLFKTRFSVGLNRRTFEEASGEAEVNILWTFAKRGIKSAFSLPTTWGDFFGGTRTGRAGAEM